VSPPEPIPATGWRASLALDYRCDAGRTWLAGRRHSGPLLVQKPFYPEGPGVCQTLIIHPPSGIAGGDALELSVRVGPGAHAQVTTPGAAKWYRSVGPLATLDQSLSVAPGGRLEWLPQESIFFDGAFARSRTRVDLGGDAVFLGWDLIALGRPAAGETFDHGGLALDAEIWHEGRLVWTELGRLAGADRLLTDAAGFGGAAASGTLLLAGVRVGDDLLAACREVAADEGCWGITRLPEVLVARWLGRETATGRAWFTGLWSLLRPAALGREALVPRIWNT
jgi:urease accessory protein